MNQKDNPLGISEGGFPNHYYRAPRLTLEFTPLLGLYGRSGRAGQASPKQIKVTDNKDLLKDEIKEKRPHLAKIISSKETCHSTDHLVMPLPALLPRPGSRQGASKISTRRSRL